MLSSFKDFESYFYEFEELNHQGLGENKYSSNSYEEGDLFKKLRPPVSNYKLSF